MGVPKERIIRLEENFWDIGEVIKWIEYRDFL